MSSVTLYSSVSVDGFATGPGGDLTRLHRWLFDFDGGQARSVDDENTAAFAAAGAYIFGNTTLRSGEEPWGDEAVFSAPVFVLTHDVRPPVRRNGALFTFVNGGPSEALRLAADAAGDRGVVIMGSPDVAGQFLRAGLVDRILLHLVPVLLGGGTRLFGDAGGYSGNGQVELRLDRMVAGVEASQLAFTVVRDERAD